MNRSFTLSNFFQFASKDLELSEQYYQNDETSDDENLASLSQNTINNILNYSNAISIFKSKVAGNFGLLLN